ncbi:hypothetical protein HMPREF1991_01499 [Hoylesella loescheii DSM 19665 = JCM 12249 = ATCC 15930]|uniref:Uncharacterized protein n=1 Tax=Hoylesella loescheii DSM 19665 = JCM 12249 = ATCC 15930 TaxID=1122985 RepID=A0A069QI91_HOYLO|nr:hypothetical protein HMPREF1991_01499 [Hoylesella loescheii DSM 19665 = JCM 12249 = ATCC 15930]
MLSFFIPTETHRRLTIDAKNINRNENVGFDRDRETTKTSAIAGNWYTQREQLEGQGRRIGATKIGKSYMA